MKKAEDADALIMRVYNPSETAMVADSIEFSDAVSSWKETSMDERVRDTEYANQSFGELAACQARTFQIKF